MFSLLLFGLIASAFAAPQFQFRHHEHGPPPFFPDYHMRGQLNEDLFDTSRFWADISKELREIDDMLADFSRRFPTSVSREGIEGTEYKITIPLSGFEEKDIVVKAREGLLMIQASHKYPGGSERNYLDIRNLPNTVNVTGTWIFENGSLKIVFPLKNGVETQTVETVTVVSTEFTTGRPSFDREEIEKTDDDNEGIQDVDVGLNRGDLDANREVLTNEISSNGVEATTYAVDLTNEVEFVPVRF